MSAIIHLQISNFRNLQSTLIEPGPHFNIIYGENGAGKTSVLEAIYYFSFGRSFRTNNASYIIHKNSEHFALHSKLHFEDKAISIGIERDRNAGRRIRFNGENLKTIAPIAELLPTQLICTESYRFFHDGPKMRRRFLDWGLFHVEPRFYPLWQRLTHVLKQRNAALKSGVAKSELLIWDKELITHSEEINTLRANYVEQLKPVLNRLLNAILGPLSFQLSYYPGWRSSNFEADLHNSFYKDRMVGYTSTGPHRADVQLLLENRPAEEFLSRGQQKLASYALCLAQGQLVSTNSKKKPIYLIDDLPSELDPTKRACIVSTIASLNAQVFITGITQENLSDVIAIKDSLLFHVEHNDIHDKHV